MYPNMYSPTTTPMYGVVPPATQRKTIDRVNGRNGAELYALDPDSSALLLDVNDPIVWFVQTDSAGYKTVIPYDIKKHEDEPMPDFKSLDTRLDSFDERLKVIEEALK